MGISRQVDEYTRQLCRFGIGNLCLSAVCHSCLRGKEALTKMYDWSTALDYFLQLLALGLVCGSFLSWILP